MFIAHHVSYRINEGQGLISSIGQDHWLGP